MTVLEHDAGYKRLADGAPDRLTDNEIGWRIARLSAATYPTQIAGLGVGLVSVAAIGALGDTTALAAVGLSNVMTLMLGFSWLWGLSAGISTLAAQNWGAGAHEAVGLTLQRGFLVCFLLCDIPLGLMWLKAEDIMIAAGQPPDVARLVGLYARIRLPGILCETVSVCMHRTLGSIGDTVVRTTVSGSTSLLLLILTLLLIPRYGFVGAPVAATFCDVYQAVTITAGASRSADFRKCWPGWDKRALQDVWKYLTIAFPAYLLLANEVWCWFGQDFLAGYVSKVAMATNGAIPPLTGVVWCAGASVGSGAGTVVGNLLGEGRPGDARRACYLSMLMNQVLLLPHIMLLVCFREELPRFFTRDEEVMASMARLIPLTLLFSCMDSQQAVLTAIISAAGKQGAAAPIITVCYWVVGVPLGAALAFGWIGEPLGLEGLWMGMIVGVCLHSTSFAWLTWRIDWEATALEVAERTTSDNISIKQSVAKFDRVVASFSRDSMLQPFRSYRKSMATLRRTLSEQDRREPLAPLSLSRFVSA